MIQNCQEKIEIMVVTIRENDILWSSVKLKFPLLKTITLFLTKTLKYVVQFWNSPSSMSEPHGVFPEIC